MDHALLFSLQLEQYPGHADVMRQFAETNGIPFDLERIQQLIEARQSCDMQYTDSASSETEPTDNLGKWRHYITSKRSKAHETTHLNQTSLAQQVHDGGPLQGSELVAAVVARRRELSLTQTEFARRLGVSVRTYQEWEQKRRKPSGPAESVLKKLL